MCHLPSWLLGPFSFTLSVSQPAVNLTSCPNCGVLMLPLEIKPNCSISKETILRTLQCLVLSEEWRMPTLIRSSKEGLDLVLLNHRWCLEGSHRSLGSDRGSNQMLRWQMPTRPSRQNQQCRNQLYCLGSPAIVTNNEFLLKETSFE